jgi:hypothetical protein
MERFRNKVFKVKLIRADSDGQSYTTSALDKMKLTVIKSTYSKYQMEAVLTLF